MRLICGSVALGLVIAVAGCRNASKPGGGTERRDQFTLKAPMTSTTVQQGETQTINLTFDRGKDFNQTIKLSAAPPKGIDAEISPASLTATEKEIHLKVTAHKDAPVGDETIRVTATPDSGKATYVDVKVKVREEQRAENRADGAKSQTAGKVTLSGPSTSTKVKQGAAETIKLTLRYDKNFNHDVKLSVEAPKDIKAEVSPDMMHPNDKGEVNLTVHVEQNATPGDRIVRVTATPEGEAASASTSEVHLKVTGQ